MIKVDSHLHTCASKDGIVLPVDVIKIARARGLDRICITDHNRIDGALAAKEIDPELVIVGEEILTAQGQEILAFFVSEWVPPHLSHHETLARLEAQGAVISVSHPFDRYRNRPWTAAMLEAILPRLDAIEGFNARASRRDNQKAESYAMSHNLPMTAGSDAHIGLEIGAAYLEMPPFVTAQEFRAALPQATIQGKLSPLWVRLFPTFNKWRGRLGLKPTLS